MGEVAVVERGDTTFKLSRPADASLLARFSVAAF